MKKASKPGAEGSPKQGTRKEAKGKAGKGKKRDRKPQFLPMPPDEWLESERARKKSTPANPTLPVQIEEPVEPPFFIPQRFQKRLLKKEDLPSELQLQIEHGPFWMKADFWRQVAKIWNEQHGEDDMQRYCNFLAREWELSEGIIDHRIYRLLAKATIAVFQESCERLKMLWRHKLDAERRYSQRMLPAYNILGLIYRQQFTLPNQPLRTEPEKLPDFEKARVSAIRATWKAAGKDCEQFLENRLNDMLLKSGAIKCSKAPSKRIRKTTPFEKNPRVFVCGNWIQCHLWLMTPKARRSFAKMRCASGISSGALIKIIKRAQLYCHPYPPINVVNQDGTLAAK